MRYVHIYILVYSHCLFVCQHCLNVDVINSSPACCRIESVMLYLCTAVGLPLIEILVCLWSTLVQAQARYSMIYP